MLVPHCELRLADTVILDGLAPWRAAIVNKITDTEVTLFRPYGTTAEFSYSGGVICYVGIEEFTIPRQSSVPVEVVARKELK
jgi:hypothetical protein